LSAGIASASDLLIRLLADIPAFHDAAYLASSSSR
jgi:hypothetical protein